MSIQQETMVSLLMGHRAMLLGYINSIVRDFGLAEDVFQEISIIILRKFADLEDAAHLGVWARKIARFQALNALRKQSHLPHPLGDDLIDLLDAQWTATESMQENEHLERLRHCMGTMTEKSRELLKMRYHQDLSSSQIATELKRPLNTIYVAISRIHRFLSKCLKHESLTLQGEAVDV